MAFVVARFGPRLTVTITKPGFLFGTIIRLNALTITRQIFFTGTTAITRFIDTLAGLVA
jgi:hypothetical protein